jgi:DNA invertase Pin-like site-specific DNA recombinase
MIAISSYERDVLIERTKHGLAAARARGRIGGAKPKMTPAKLRLAQASMGKPETIVGDLCKEIGVSRQTLYRMVTPTGELRPDGEKLLKAAGK